MSSEQEKINLVSEMRLEAIELLLSNLLGHHLAMDMNARDSYEYKAKMLESKMSLSGLSGPKDVSEIEAREFLVRNVLKKIIRGAQVVEDNIRVSNNLHEIKKVKFD